jgi:DNA-binding response OmpR family regulator
MPGARVLVADDEPSIREILKLTLTEQGFLVLAVEDGEKALAAAQVSFPDVIITDVRMPNMDGWALVRRLRSMREFALVPVIFLTVLDSSADRLRGYNLGADDYLAKPFKKENLISRVRQALERRAEIASVLALDVPSKDTGAPALRGRLDQIGLPSLLTLLEAERKNGSLVLSRPHRGETGRIFLRDGRVVSASLDDKPTLAGAEAVYFLLTWGEGTFEFSAFDVLAEDTVGRATSQLLLEGAHLQDEIQRPT